MHLISKDRHFLSFSVPVLVLRPTFFDEVGLGLGLSLETKIEKSLIFQSQCIVTGKYQNQVSHFYKIVEKLFFE